MLSPYTTCSLTYFSLFDYHQQLPHTITTNKPHLTTPQQSKSKIFIMPFFWFTKPDDDDDMTAIKEFISACKPVQDLPFQNGDEDWKAFFAARERMKARNPPT